MKLELKNIYKSFGTKDVLKGISLTAESGKAFGYLGRNGAGKTTTIRILMNVFGSDGGEILVDSKPIDHNQIGIGYLPEERGLYPKKIIIEQLVYFAMLKGMNKKDATAACDKWLKRLEMDEYRNRRLDTLSKGNQQKIQLVTALAHNPDIVVLDEPFSGLDPVNALLLKDIVKEEIERGKIVLFSSHQMNYIEEFCDDIAILNGGKVVLEGNLAEIKRNHVRDKLVVRSPQQTEIARAYSELCSEAEDGSLIVRMKNESDKAQLMQELAGRYDIDELKVYEPSLNDIFVEYAASHI